MHSPCFPFSSTVSSSIKQEPLATKDANTGASLAPINTICPQFEQESSAVYLDSCKAQRAVRRDVVNARRDKRKQYMDKLEIDDVPFPFKTDVLEHRTSLTPKRRKSLTNDIHSDMDLANSELQSAAFDSDSKEAKKKRRLIRNRMSAQLHRERKKAYVGHLEQQLFDREVEIKELQEKIAVLTRENEALKVGTEKICFESASSQQLQAEKYAALPDDSIKCDAIDPTSPIDSDPLNSDSLYLERPVFGENETDMLHDLDDVILSTDDNTASDLCHWLVDTDYFLSEPSLLKEDKNLSFKSSGLRDVNSECLSSPRDPQSPNMHAFAAAAAHVFSATPKKNMAMMVAMIFSVSFFGECAHFFNDLAYKGPFSYIFDSNTSTNFTQFTITSRMLDSLDKTSWKDFQDSGSWTSENCEAECVETNNCDLEDKTDMELLTNDDFFEPPGSEALFTEKSSSPRSTDSTDGESDEESAQKSSEQPNLYEKLRAMWQDTRHIVMTITNPQRPVYRSIADFSIIKQYFEKTIADKPTAKPRKGMPLLTKDSFVRFLYPMDALVSLPVDQMASNPLFVEITCHF